MSDAGFETVSDGPRVQCGQSLGALKYRCIQANGVPVEDDADDTPSLDDAAVVLDDVGVGMRSQFSWA